MKYTPFLTILFLVGLMHTAQAGTEKFINYLSDDEIKPNAVLVVQDDKFGNKAWQDIEVTHSVDNYVIFEVNEDVLQHQPAAYLVDRLTYILDLQIEYWEANADPKTAPSKMVYQSLSIDYNTKAASTTPYKTFFQLKNAHRIKVTVLNMKTDGGTWNGQYPPFRLSAEIIVNRQYLFSCTEQPLFMDFPNVNTTKSDNYTVSWSPPSSGAEEYDLEWTFYDLESKIGQKIANGSNDNYSDFGFLFRHNATRISTTETKFTTPLLYPAGYLFYRVRAVRTMNGLRETGVWTSQRSETISGFSHKILVGWHEDKLNWQAQTSFAEGGKHVPSIRYFDGSLRERQAVTQSNAIDGTYGSNTYDTMTIASETIYDHQGRPALSVMPAPTFDRIIAYDENFANRSNGTPYTKTHFDTGGCSTEPSPMDDNTGVGRYYSNKNPASTDTEGFQRFVPDAENYPFTVTEYTPDLTGRIKRQSGVGMEHRLGSGHETKYFYGKPAQEELDRLFGNEVGFASHYFKNMVQDANEQLSISYVDAHGQTVASALAGTTPLNVDSLPNHTPVDTLTRDLLNNVASTYALTSTYSMLVTNNGEYTFDYSVDTARYKPNCLPTNTCYDCLYDLTITITDNCGNSYNNNQAAVVKRQNYVGGTNAFNTFCNTHPTDILADTVLILPTGEYMVTKTLSISQEALEYYTDQFIAETTCIPSYDTILADFKSQIDTTGCNLTCEECHQQLDDIVQQGGEVTEEERTACDALCAGQNECESLLNLMMADVSPNGQYALYQTTDNITLDALLGDPTSIYTNNGHQNLLMGAFYPDENGERDSVFVNGQLVPPTALNVTDFITYWKPSWARPLVEKYHPEYCYYEWCLENEDSADFDETLLSIDTYQDAIDAGVIDASGNILGDPFFEMGGAGEAYDTTLNQLLNYGGPESCIPLTMINLASALAYCGGETLLCPTLFGQGCTADNNIAWEIFRNLYIGIKYQIKSDIWANLPDCDNACIGSSNNCADCENGGSPLCIGGVNPYTDKQARAVRFETPDISMGLTAYNNSQTMEQQAGLDDWCASVCENNADFWLNQLDSCGISSLSEADSIELRQRLIAVCELGCDETHPFGSTTTKMAQATSFGDRSFEDALTAVIGTQNVCSNCNANLINFPGTYENPVWNGASIPISQHFTPDTCLCERYTELNNCFMANSAAYNGSFSEFLSAFADIYITDVQLDELKIQCNDSFCADLPDNFIIPPMMECETCYTCGYVDTLVMQFNTDHCMPSETNYETYRTRWLNDQLGFTLTTEDYAAALAQCASLNMCDDLRLVCPRSAYGAVQLEDDCATILLAQATTNAQIAYEQIIDSLQATFINEYLEQCLTGLNENFTYTGAYNEYHFTLYYYDQAGNLVKTIPPKGVMPITSQNSLDSVADYRADVISLAAYPEHTFETKYVYNSLNEVVRQVSPDATESQFWYDRVGRLVVSQDGRQSPDNLYSYTTFDAQGRIIEVGEILQPFVGMNSFISRNPPALNGWLNQGTKKQVTRTYYDRAIFNITSFGTDGQENLRSRVASVTIEENNNDNNPNTYDYATHYSYDASGNVKTLVQEIKDLHQYGHGYKRIDYDYDYDYISGNVNLVSYQRDSTDQFFHEYTYDATNRLTLVRTNLVSDDPMDGNWEEDVEYEYYLHGPLARTELGQRDVQGMDYAYTIQGWIKGMNSSALSVDRDMGKDDKVGTSHQGFAKDAIAFTLGYFDGDYSPIGNSNFELDYDTYSFNGSSPSLYNGNIRHSVLDIRQFNTPLAYAYTYDQLHRIKEAVCWHNPDVVNYSWNNATTTLFYGSTYKYDPNGNLTQLRRNNQTGGLMDVIRYEYIEGTNQLEYVTDNSGGDEPNFPDVTTQNAGNYEYDGSGNIISDAQAGNTIDWSVYGKVLEVNYPDSNRTILYGYGADQNRVMKASVTDVMAQDTVFSYYFRDAQGNVMSVYNRHQDTVSWQEQHLYGSTRLGLLKPNVSWVNDDLEDEPYFTGTLMSGWKRYELSNHLGNVLTVINDKQASGLPTIISANDYYPFGMAMPERTFSSPLYRYGFNGKENDLSFGDLVHLDYGFRIYHSGLGKFLSVDPLTRKYPELTPYQFAHNSPIVAIDLDGLEAVGTNEEVDETFNGGDVPEATDNESSSQSNREFKDTDNYSNLIRQLEQFSRGNGDDAPYFYLGGGISGDLTNSASEMIVKMGVINENILVNRFMKHWEFGGGQTYELSNSEFEGISIREYDFYASLGFESELSQLELGGSKFISFNVPVSSNQSATVGDATMKHSGTLSKTKNGDWSFTGTASLFDIYDFDLRTFERPLFNWTATLAGKIANGPGNIFNVIGPNIPISINSSQSKIRFPQKEPSPLIKLP